MMSGVDAGGELPDLIKDKDAAISLEQQSRMQLTGESLDKQIAEIYALHQAQPESIDLARRLGALNERKNDIEAATTWYEYAADLTKGTDAGLLRKISDLKMKRFEREIARMRSSCPLTARITNCMRKNPRS